jgi:thioredoxin-related protein
MKKIPVILAVLLIMCPLVYSQTSFPDGLAKAKSGGKKIIVNIYSESDSWSQKMDKVYLNDKINSIINASFVYVKLNGNGSDKISYGGKEYTASSLAKQFGATGYPTHVVLNPDGSVITFIYNGEQQSSFSGYLDAGAFESFLKYFAETKYKDTDLNKVF